MLVFRINLSLLIIPSVFSLAISEEGVFENRLSFELPRWFLSGSASEHVVLTGHNLVDMGTNDSIFNIHYRYSIHDNRLVIRDSNDDHELYKVMCKRTMNCLILKDGMILFRMDVSNLQRNLYEGLSRPRLFGIGHNWTISTLPDQKKVLLFHAGYSTQQPLAEFAPFEILSQDFEAPNYSLHIAQQSLFEPAFLLAMGIILQSL